MFLVEFLVESHVAAGEKIEKYCAQMGGGGPMAKNGEKWRKMAMANSAFSFVKFAIFRQFLILEFHI